MRLLLDTNVILDVLTGREPMVKDSAAVLTYIDEGHAVGLVAAHAVTTIHTSWPSTPAKRKRLRQLWT